jgi:hypothetical protein
MSTHAATFKTDSSEIIREAERKLGEKYEEIVSLMKPSLIREFLAALVSGGEMTELNRKRIEGNPDLKEWFQQPTEMDTESTEGEEEDVVFLYPNDEGSIQDPEHPEDNYSFGDNSKSKIAENSKMKRILKNGSIKDCVVANAYCMFVKGGKLYYRGRASSGTAHVRTIKGEKTTMEFPFNFNLQKFGVSQGEFIALAKQSDCSQLNDSDSDEEEDESDCSQLNDSELLLLDEQWVCSDSDEEEDESDCSQLNDSDSDEEEDEVFEGKTIFPENQADVNFFIMRYIKKEWPEMELCPQPGTGWVILKKAQYTKHPVTLHGSSRAGSTESGTVTGTYSDGKDYKISLRGKKFKELDELLCIL